MDGITLKTDRINEIPLTEECRADVVWDTKREAWYLDMSMRKRHGWETVLTGHFKSLDRLNEVLETARTLTKVED